MKRQDDWRLDFTGPATAVLTNVMGRRRVITFRRRKRNKDGPWMRAAKWIVPAVICFAAAWMAGMLVILWYLGEP